MIRFASLVVAVVVFTAVATPVLAKAAMIVG